MSAENALTATVLVFSLLCVWKAWLLWRVWESDLKSPSSTKACRCASSKPKS